MQIEQVVVKLNKEQCPNLDVINKKNEDIVDIFGQNSRISNPTDSPLTVLADSSLKTLLQPTLIFGMRCIHYCTLEHWDLLPAE